MDKQLLKKAILPFVSLTEEEFEYFYNLLKFNEFKRKEMLLTAGQVCRNAFFTANGLIRYYHVISGEEVTGQFFFEGSWYTDYESFLLNIPSSQNIQALEKSSVAMLSNDSLQKLYKEVPKFERFGRLIAENAYLGLRKKQKSIPI